MHFFQAVMECHHDLNKAASELLGELECGEITPRLLRLRLEMVNFVRQNLAATQRLWSWIEREIPDIRRQIPVYDRLKVAERNLHLAYSSHIAQWPLSKISRDFHGYAKAKRDFLSLQYQHTRSLELQIFDPVHGIVSRVNSFSHLAKFSVPARLLERERAAF